MGVGGGEVRNESVAWGWGSSSTATPTPGLRGGQETHCKWLSALGGLRTTLQPLSRAILPLLLSFPVANPSSHLKGIRTQAQIIASGKVAAQFIKSLLFVEEVAAGSAALEWWQQEKKRADFVLVMPETLQQTALGSQELFS